MSTKVLLVNSPLFVVPDKNFNEDVIPSIGLAYIATNLDIIGIECHILDAVANNRSVKEVVQFVDGSSFTHIGLNIFSTNFSIVKQIVEEIAKDIGTKDLKEIYK